jgi:hypothetical protein
VPPFVVVVLLLDELPPALPFAGVVMVVFVFVVERDHGCP